MRIAGIAARCQAICDANIREIRGWVQTRPGREGMRVWEHPFAITLDVGTSLINHTGSVAHTERRTEYVHRLRPAITPPGRRGHQGWLAYAESWPITKRPGRFADRKTIRSRR